MPQYSVQNATIENLLGYIINDEVSIPEMQRPFVWKGDQIRDLIDSLYNGYPIGYLIIWQNPDIIDKNGERTIGKKIMIDGQQRITALMTSIIGRSVIDKDFKDKVHRISFNPYAAAEGNPCFDVMSAAIRKDKRWIPDISVLFSKSYNSFEFIPKFCSENPDMDSRLLNELVEKVRDIRNAPIGIINLDKELSIDRVTEIFIRINSKGSSLTQADFVMSTMAADTSHNGNLMRKAIDYFCHLFANHNFMQIVDKDSQFTDTEYYNAIKWVAATDTSLISLSFDEVLRIAFLSQYFRGKMSNLTDLLHGRNFETRKYEAEIMADSFERFSRGLSLVFNKYLYQQFVEILKGAGFISPRLIRGRMALVFAYMLFIRLHESKEVESIKIAGYVRRWYVMSILTGRYASSPETFMDDDLRAIREKGFLRFYDDAMANLSETFWEITLTQRLETSSISAPAFNVFLAAQCKDVDPSFLSDSTRVRDILDSADIHHIFPKQYLKDNGMNAVIMYNQVANYVYLSRPVNINVGKDSPKKYMTDVLEAIDAGSTAKYTTIASREALRQNLEANCIPADIVGMEASDYDSFLRRRRELMAAKIRRYFESL